MTGAIFFCPLLRAPEVPAAFLCRAERGNDRERDITFLHCRTSLLRIAVHQVEAELDDIRTLCLCGGSLCGIGQAGNDLHVPDGLPRGHKKMRPAGPVRDGFSEDTGLSPSGLKLSAGYGTCGSHENAPACL